MCRHTFTHHPTGNYLICEECGEIRINYTPLPKQREFHNSSHQFRAYVGGFGSGKTLCGSVEAILLSTADTSLDLKQAHRGVGVIGAQTYPQLRDTTQRTFLEICPTPLIKNFNKAENALTLINGFTILFRAFDDPGKLKSLNLNWWYIDEASEVPEDIFLALKGRLRNPSTGFHRGFITSNPEGKNWVWKWFHPNSPLQITNEHVRSTHKLIHAPTTENIHLPRSYIDNLLNTYPESWVKRYVMGEFDAFEGQIYTDFNPQKHTVPETVLEEEEQFIISIDHGFTNPTAVLFATYNQALNAVTIHKEIYRSNQLIPETSEQIKAIYQKLTNKPFNPLKVIALIDPSTKGQRGHSGRSIFEDYIENGIPVIPANNKVVAGILKVMLAFRHDKILINSVGCPNLIQELETYRWKPKAPNAEANEPEEPIKKDDHAADALRYLIQWVFKEDRDIYKPVDAISILKQRQQNVLDEGKIPFALQTEEQRILSYLDI